jgi:hypothetical protein
VGVSKLQVNRHEVLDGGVDSGGRPLIGLKRRRQASQRVGAGARDARLKTLSSGDLNGDHLAGLMGNGGSALMVRSG